MLLQFANFESQRSSRIQDENIGDLEKSITRRSIPIEELAILRSKEEESPKVRQSVVSDNAKNTFHTLQEVW